jgi:hypothetical protein
MVTSQSQVETDVLINSSGAFMKCDRINFLNLSKFFVNFFDKCREIGVSIELGIVIAFHSCLPSLIAMNPNFLYGQCIIVGSCAKRCTSFLKVLNVVGAFMTSDVMVS